MNNVDVRKEKQQTVTYLRSQLIKKMLGHQKISAYIRSLSILSQ